MSEQDQTLLKNGMELIAEDTELKDFLGINRAYVRLIRGLCGLVVAKKDEVCQNLRVELIESNIARIKLESYIKGKELELRKHIKDIKIRFSR